jgi:hypothetical protein
MSEAPKPISTCTPDWSKVEEMLVKHVRRLFEDGYGTKDVKQYVFEAAMEAVYGEDIWKTYNRKMK